MDGARFGTPAIAPIDVNGAPQHHLAYQFCERRRITPGAFTQLHETFEHDVLRDIIRDVWLQHFACTAPSENGNPQEKLLLLIQQWATAGG